MKPVTLDINFPEVERDILQKWENESIFQKQNAKRAEAKEFSFYDGPPFANGLPHYGHLLANSIKDTVTRFWTMKGFKIDRRFGWDCHGLPVEFEIEKRDNLKGRPDILKMGVDRFNETCRDSVLHYAAEWRKTITRLGRWVDWDNQYRTMDKNYMESVWWVFGELYKKGLVYQDFKVVPYSPRTSSVVSNFEANQNYKMVQDPSVVVKFKLKQSNDYLLCWTTTPWTLPANLALAIGKSISYVRIKDTQSGETWILAEGRVASLYEKIKKEGDEELFEILGPVPVAELVGQSYEPLFPYFKDEPQAFKVLSAEFVSTEDGTGVVHQAPAFGEDDFYTCKQAGIKLVDPIDDNGCFTDLVPEYKGTYFKDADKLICKDLKTRGLLIRQDVLVHSYPFDERTDTPLMYKAVPSWYVAVEKIVANLLKNNGTINWVPGHLQEGRMGTWLANARDWSISRNRFWGTPLPIWVCDADKAHLKVISSVAELESVCDQKVTDLHVHKIKHIHLKCSHCSGSMKLIELVFDCWFESGSMPYAQMHYPFENADRFPTVFPADFVAEGLDQTRGWFYTLNVLSSALFDQPAFKNVIVNGVILDERGKKMSKRHRNYTPPDELIEKNGADSVRLYMLNSALLRAEDLIFSDKGVKDIARLVLLPLWNAHSFLVTYAIADQWKPSVSLCKGKAPSVTHDLDRWVLSRLESLKLNVTKHMEEYKLYLVVPELLEFIEDLTNWYIRLSRRRFWGTDENPGVLSQEQQEAFSTLYYVLVEFCKILSPFAPFISDKIYQNLVEEAGESSVHLCDMPVVSPALRDEALEKEMALMRQAVNQGRFLRQKHKIKIRQVLASMTVITADENDRSIILKGENLLKNELNVKNILFTTDEEKHVRLSLKPNLQVLGKRLGKKTAELNGFLKKLSENAKAVAELYVTLKKTGQVVLLDEALVESDFIVERSPLDDCIVSTENGVTILFDTHLTPELVAEGRAREVVNRVQNLRKDSGLKVSDRIRMVVTGPNELLEALLTHKSYILSETLSVDMDLLTDPAGGMLKFQEAFEVDSMNGVVSLEVAKD